MPPMYLTVVRKRMKQSAVVHGTHHNKLCLQEKYSEKNNIIQNGDFNESMGLGWTKADWIGTHEVWKKQHSGGVGRVR